MTTKLRRPRYRTLREDYVQFCGGNTVAALLLDYFASADRLHDEAREQGERRSKWRAISTRRGGKLTVLSPQPSRETMRKALDKLCELGLFDAHPDNEKPAEPNSIPKPARYRLNGRKLLRLEHEWMLHANKDSEGMVAQTTTPGSAHYHPWEPTLPLDSVLEGEKKERSARSLETETLPDHLSPADRRIVKLAEVPRPNGDGGAQAYAIIEAYLNEWNVVVKKFRDAIHRDDKKHAARLVELGATPDEVAAMCRERRAKQHQMSDFPLAFVARDYVTWKMKQETAAPAPRVLSEAERAAQEAALEAERVAWRKEQGLV